jgi:hypothetical protein
MNLKKIINNWKQFDRIWWITELIGDFILILAYLWLATNCVAGFVLNGTNTIQKTMIGVGYFSIVYVLYMFNKKIICKIRRSIRNRKELKE